MNLNSKKVPEKEIVNTKHLSNIYRQQNIKGGLSYKGPLGSNRISYPILSVEDFERRFQFNNVVRSYNNLIGNKKRIFNSDGKGNSKGLYLPVIKEIKIVKHGMNDDNVFNESGFMQESENHIQLMKNNQKYYNSSDNNEMECSNINNEVNQGNLKSNYYGTNSTLSQSVIFNKSNLHSKISSDNERERKRILLRNLSHDSIFAAYKARYLLAKKEFKNKSKLAEMDYKMKLEKLKQEKMPKSKNEEFFKEYEIKFNENKMKEKLKVEYNFFRNDIERRAINETDLRLDKLFKRLKRNEERKNIIGYFDKKHSTLKPSQRSIKNMLRKEKREELIDSRLLDLDLSEEES